MRGVLDARGLKERQAEEVAGRRRLEKRGGGREDEGKDRRIIQPTDNRASCGTRVYLMQFLSQGNKEDRPAMSAAMSTARAPAAREARQRPNRKRAPGLWCLLFILRVPVDGSCCREWLGMTYLFGKTRQCSCVISPSNWQD